MTSKSPLISVIMPAYNASAFIATAIDSLLEQTHVNWELLVVNDGSKDDTEAKILAYQDARIHYFKQENAGVSAARNVALRQMQGAFFCFLDADDAYPPDSLALRLKAFEEGEQVCFVDGTVVLKDANLDKVDRIKKHTFHGNPHTALMALDERCFFGPSWMIRRNPDTVYAFKDGMTHGEDLYFYLCISQKGAYRAIDAPVLWYRQTGTSAMSNLKGLEQGYATLYKEIKQFPAATFFRKWYLKRRLIRIMVLSYLKRKQFGAAFRVFFRYLWL